MKTNGSAIIALLLWLLFFAANALALHKSPYPPPAGPPEPTIIVSDGGLDSIVGTANRPE